MKVKAPSPIKSIKIEGLQQNRTVDVKFKNAFTVLIAENGMGKTTLLSILYAVLTGSFHKLNSHDFQRITVTFRDNSKTSINRDDISAESQLPEVLQKWRRTLTHSDYLELIEAATSMSPQRFRTNNTLREKLKLSPMEMSRLQETLSRYRTDVLFEMPTNKLSLTEARDKIKKAINFELLYFPTYRRIEESHENLGYQSNDRESRDSLIQFGMEDVSIRIRNLTTSIKDSSVAWYSKINGEILSHLVEGLNNSYIDSSYQSNLSALNIVLDRVGNSISKTTREKILSLVNTKQIDAQEYNPLSYFLSKLMLVYNQQKAQDDAIKAFVSVCNKYLVNKEIIYDESLVVISIIDLRTQMEISLAMLSSGEKQIVSLFSVLYLTDDKDFGILFDEPELSLSLEWQRQLLPDILATDRCKFLLAATHSPFIFENELDMFAVDLASYVEYFQ
ncbi:MAG TPA: AAA family ATPase [Fimbriimonas sp.]|nr:AAA family ATPase [Fimbriimonas sp.]